MLNVGLCKQLDSTTCSSNENCQFNKLIRTPLPALEGGNCRCESTSAQIGQVDGASSLEKCDAKCNGEAECVYFVISGNTECRLYRSSCLIAASTDHKCYFKSSFSPPSNTESVCTHQFAVGSDSSKVEGCKARTTESSCTSSTDCVWNYALPPKILSSGCYCRTSSLQLAHSLGETTQSCLRKCKSTVGCQMFSLSTSNTGSCYLSSATCTASPSSEYNCYYLPGYVAPATTENACTHA